MYRRDGSEKNEKKKEEKGKTTKHCQTKAELVYFWAVFLFLVCCYLDCFDCVHGNRSWSGEEEDGRERVVWEGKVLSVLAFFFFFCVL